MGNIINVNDIAEVGLLFKTEWIEKAAVFVASDNF